MKKMANRLFCHPCKLGYDLLLKQYIYNNSNISKFCVTLKNRYRTDLFALHDCNTRRRLPHREFPHITSKTCSSHYLTENFLTLPHRVFPHFTSQSISSHYLIEYFLTLPQRVFPHITSQSISSHCLIDFSSHYLTKYFLTLAHRVFPHITSHSLCHR